ncbi:tail completion protein gp17 [Salipaludibacillus sp. CF4.18]|uniref:tail completion protein gp17 n=1 Tax=Salipaludibacillus sp. CF4.18 TaxID=3373081 RepID=UPI003EE606C0
MRNIATVLFQQINQAHSNRTFQGLAPQTITLSDGSVVPTPYPYVVYKLLPMSNRESGRDDYNIEVSCWDKSTGTSHATVMELAERVNDSLLEFASLDEHNLVAVSRPNIGYVPDPDAEIKRYDVTAMIRTYRR